MQLLPGMVSLGWQLVSPRSSETKGDFSLSDVGVLQRCRSDASKLKHFESLKFFQLSVVREGRPLSPALCAAGVAPRVQTVWHWSSCDQCNVATTPLSESTIKTRPEPSASWDAARHPGPQVRAAAASHEAAGASLAVLPAASDDPLDSLTLAFLVSWSLKAKKEKKDEKEKGRKKKEREDAQFFFATLHSTSFVAATGLGEVLGQVRHAALCNSG